jgi:hypothetical protein
MLMYHHGKTILKGYDDCRPMLFRITIKVVIFGISGTRGLPDIKIFGILGRYT